MAVTAALYMSLMKLLPRDARSIASRLFAGSAIAIYYWYRLPMLFGLGVFPGEGMLIDLRSVVPLTAVLPLQLAEAAFWGWWFVAPDRQPRAWEVRPKFATEKRVQTVDASASHARAGRRPAGAVPVAAFQENRTGA